MDHGGQGYGGSSPTLDALLFIPALASSSALHEATLPVVSWVRSLGLDETT